MSKLSILTKGIIKENPVLILILGTCPALATTTQVSSALGMGVAATAVLICSNIAISALKRVIPTTVRIPCYIVLIASFVTIVQMVIKALAPALNDSLGIYLPLIVVNCIILGRAEMFANKNSVVDSALDGIGMGIGFTLTLILMATFREVLGNGTWFGIEIPFLADNPIMIVAMAPGGFCVYGLIIAIVNRVNRGKRSPRMEFSCEGCPSADACDKVACGEKEVAAK